MRLRRKEMLALIRQLGAYVQSASGGDEQKILSSGFDTVAVAGSRPPVGQVYNLRLKEGTWTGQIRALWNKVPGAVCYEVHLSEALHGDSFRHYRTVCKTRFVLTDLEPGRIYYVRIIAVGRRGYGAFSDIGTKVAAL